MTDQRMVGAVLDLERLLVHLRSCPECYVDEPCLVKHCLVKDVIGTTEAARVLARAVHPAEEYTMATTAEYRPADETDGRLIAAGRDIREALRTPEDTQALTEAVATWDALVVPAIPSTVRPTPGSDDAERGRDGLPLQA